MGSTGLSQNTQASVTTDYRRFSSPVAAKLSSSSVAWLRNSCTCHAEPDIAVLARRSIFVAAEGRVQEVECDGESPNDPPRYTTGGLNGSHTVSFHSQTLPP